MSAQRRLQILSGHLAPVTAQPATAALATSHTSSSTAPHAFQQDLEAAHAQQGVLAYGLEITGRAPLRVSWQPPISDPDTSTHPFSKSTDPKHIDTKGLTTVDRYNNLTWREFPKRFSEAHGPFGEHGSKLSDPQLQTALTEFRKAESSAAKLSPQEARQAQDFQQGLLAHPSYSPFRTRKDTSQALMTKEGHTTTHETQFRSQTIRACKFGIEYGQLEGRKVMFELGGMDSAGAAGKAQVGKMSGNSGKQQRSVTNAELRKAFRSDTSDESLQFYREGKRVAAPWSKFNEEGQAWAQYMGKRMAKFEKLGFKADMSRIGPRTDMRTGFRDLNTQINKFKALQAKTAKTPSPSAPSSKPPSKPPILSKL